MRPARLALRALLLLLCLSAAREARGFELSLSGFSDVTAGVLVGQPRDASAAAKFNAFGLDPYPKSSHSGFGLVGVDLVLSADITDDLVFLTEVNLQATRGDSTTVEIDPERIFMEYRINEKINLQAGLFFTPIGYFNRNLYARAFLMTSVQVPDLFEEELNLVPTRTVGVQAHGQVRAGRGHRLEYHVSLGNGRNRSPDQGHFARDTTPFRALTGMLEWHVPGKHRQLTVGLSGWFDDFETYQVDHLGQIRGILDPATMPLHLREIGGSVHLVYTGPFVNLLLEALVQLHQDVDGVLDPQRGATLLYGGLAELSLNLGPRGRFKPYARYDLAQLSEDSPYLGLRQQGEEVTLRFVPQTNLLMGGLAVDLNTHLRAKIEYSYAFTGPRAAHAAIAQIALGF